MSEANSSSAGSPRRPIAVVLGASGYMGSNLAPALAAHGWHVRAVARSAAVLEAREWPGVECWSADVLQPETPAGFRGLLYWFAHLPLYSPLVRSAVAEIARRAESLDLQKH